MEFKRTAKKTNKGIFLPDWESDNAIVEVKVGSKAIRSIRDALLQISYYIHDSGSKYGFLLLIEPKITDDSLKDELHKATSIFRKEISDRLSIMSFRNNQITSIPYKIDDILRDELIRIARIESPSGSSKLKKPDYSAEILKLLILHWMLNSGKASENIERYSLSADYPDEFKNKSLTSVWLADTVGCTYYPVANTLDDIGRSVLRHSDRSVSLKYFPRHAWEKMLAISENSRKSMNFVYEDPANLSRTTESLLKRFVSLKRKDVGIGGVPGARHIYPALNLTGSPRLDLTVHCPGNSVDNSFVRKLDPALTKQVNRDIKPSLVIHFLRRKKSLFQISEDGTVWADPVECLLDLQEAHLEMQALDFRNAITPGKNI